MTIAVPAVLTADEAAALRTRLEAADWIDGNATSGHQSALAKRNRQIDEAAPIARELGGIVLDALARSPLFVAAALPLRVYPPLFNRYDAGSGGAGGDAFGAHVDSAIRIRAGSDFRIRTDLSATLFLSDPASYDGGALVIEDALGRHEAKLAAGDMILYPASTLHHVTPVTRGSRIASFFWVQSMVRDAGRRAQLLELAGAIQDLGARIGIGDPALLRLTALYHNLLRGWAEL